MVSTVVIKAKKHPVVATFLTLGAIAGAAVALAQFTDIIDNAVISHEELEQILGVHSASPHRAAQNQIDLIRQETRCSSIDIQIAILNDVIWRLEQSEPSGIRLVEKKSAMNKLKKRSDKLDCAELA